MPCLFAVLWLTLCAAPLWAQPPDAPGSIVIVAPETFVGAPAPRPGDPKKQIEADLKDFIAELNLSGYGSRFVVGGRLARANRGTSIPI